MVSKEKVLLERGCSSVSSLPGGLHLHLHILSSGRNERGELGKPSSVSLTLSPCTEQEAVQDDLVCDELIPRTGSCEEGWLHRFQRRNKLLDLLSERERPSCVAVMLWFARP